MYTSFFGFQGNPFNLTPDPKYLFLSTYHKEALDHLLYGIKERKGFIAVTGGIGTGKTTLCRVLLNYLDRSVKSSLIFNSYISGMELLRAVNNEFGIQMPPNTRTKKAHIDALNRFLLDTFRDGGNAVLLIDEAQNLSHNVLEQIRMLSNLETENEKLIQIILVGQPELKELLVAPSLRQLDERITVRYELKPLSPKDIRGYVEHRLVVAGGHGNVKFTNGAFKKIYDYSRGNPRRINTVCDRSLLIAYAREDFTISRVVVDKAVKELQWDMKVNPYALGWPLKRYASFTILLVFLIIAAGLGGWTLSGNIPESFLRNVPQPSENYSVKGKIHPVSIPPSPMDEEPVSLFLDKETSIYMLFRLYHNIINENTVNTDEDNLSLYSLKLAPEYHVMFRKPFRIHLHDHSNPSSGDSLYLLISRITDDGAIAIDSKGGEQPVTRDFILNHWGEKVSWVYSTQTKDPFLIKGMQIPDVLEVQQSLNKIGYSIRTTGYYGELTAREIMKFQKDFGIMADGIVGPQTRALLYQMVE
ncbi:MAG: AAA family ATPase [Deltaproteobacteria bacterium]|nr:AAA family ATPase [Deltaproteobacteria bacterium]